MQSSVKMVKQLSVVLLVAFVAAWMGSQMVAKYSYQAEVSSGAILADSPAPCPHC